MFDTAESASLWFDIFNGVLLLGAFLVLVGTWGTIKTGAVKEKFSDERAATNETETKRAVADSDTARAGAAKANERIAELSVQSDQLRKDTAEANARAAQAQLELEKFRAPRQLTPVQQTQIANAVHPFAGQEYEITTFWELKEPLALTNAIYQALQLAGWKLFKPPNGAFLLGGIAGVQVWVHPDADPPVKEAAKALIDALRAAQLDVVAKEQNPQNPKDNKIALNVGTKQ